MKDPIHGGYFEGLLQILMASYIPPNHLQTPSGAWTGQLHHSPQGLGGTVREVVEDRQTVTSLQQDKAGMAANEAGAASDQKMRHSSSGFAKQVKWGWTAIPQDGSRVPLGCGKVAELEGDG